MLMQQLSPSHIFLPSVNRSAKAALGSFCAASNAFNTCIGMHDISHNTIMPHNTGTLTLAIHCAHTLIHCCRQGNTQQTVDKPSSNPSLIRMFSCLVQLQCLLVEMQTSFLRFKRRSFSCCASHQLLASSRLWKRMTGSLARHLFISSAVRYLQPEVSQSLSLQLAICDDYNSMQGIKLDTCEYQNGHSHGRGTYRRLHRYIRLCNMLQL